MVRSTLFKCVLLILFVVSGSSAYKDDLDHLEPEPELKDPQHELLHLREQIYNQEWYASDEEGQREVLEMVERSIELSQQLEPETLKVLHFARHELILLRDLIQNSLNKDCNREFMSIRVKESPMFDRYTKLAAFVATMNKLHYEKCREKVEIAVALVIDTLGTGIEQFKGLIKKQIDGVGADTTCKLYANCDSNLLAEAVLDYLKPRMNAVDYKLAFQDFNKYWNTFMDYIKSFQHESCLPVEAKLTEPLLDFQTYIVNQPAILEGLSYQTLNWMENVNICKHLGLIRHKNLFEVHLTRRIKYQEVKKRLLSDSIDIMRPQITRDVLQIADVFYRVKEESDWLAVAANDILKISQFRSKCSYGNVKSLVAISKKYSQYVNLKVYFDYYGDQLVLFCKDNFMSAVKTAIAPLPPKTVKKVTDLRHEIESAHVASSDSTLLHSDVPETSFVSGLGKYLNNQSLFVRPTEQPYEKDLVNLEERARKDLHEHCDKVRNALYILRLDFLQLIKFDRHQESQFDQTTRDWMTNANICLMFVGKKFDYRDLFVSMAQRGRNVGCFGTICNMAKRH